MSTNKGKNSAIWYLALGALGLYLAWIALKFIYHILSYLATNFFIGLDQSFYGQLTQDRWAGYGVLGLLLGGAAGAIAAQRRFRLNKMITAVAGLAVVTLCSFAFAGNKATAFIPSEVSDYVSADATESEENETQEEESDIKEYVGNQSVEDIQTVSQEDSVEEESTDSTMASVTSAPSEESVSESEPAVTISEEAIIAKMQAYYKAVNSNEFFAHDFFASHVKRYMKSSGISPNEINNLQRVYASEYSNGTYVIDTNTLNLVSSEGGSARYQYWSDFECFRESMQKKQSCRIKSEVEIDEKGMIVSYTEDFVRHLQYY